MPTIEGNMATEAKYKVGDKVKIVKYGALMWSRTTPMNFKLIYTDGEGMDFYDWKPELVGMEAVIDGISQNLNDYSLQFTHNGAHVAWFSEEQLENAAP